MLEEAERWIASRPRGAPEPTAETQAFVTASRRRGTTRRRNVLTGSLAAGLVVALALAGVAYWQRSIAVEQQRAANEQRQLAEEQRRRAEDTPAAATKMANSLGVRPGQRLRHRLTGVPVALYLGHFRLGARTSKSSLSNPGQATADLRRSEAAALLGVTNSLLAIGDTAAALAAAQQAKQILADLLAGNPESTDYQQELSVAYSRIGEAQAAQGDLAGALKSYRDSLAIFDRLATSDPSNTMWQRELSVAYSMVGDVQLAQGASAAALKLPLQPRHQRPVRPDPIPEYRAWQHDLSAGVRQGLGDAQVAQGDLAAQKSYREDLAIVDRLAKAQPDNAAWQRSLSRRTTRSATCRWRSATLRGR